MSPADEGGRLPRAGTDGNVLAFTPTALIQPAALVLTLLPGWTMSH
jgi:hypothetical protein